jgi:hypothetical protein
LIDYNPIQEKGDSNMFGFKKKSVLTTTEVIKGLDLLRGLCITYYPAIDLCLKKSLKAMKRTFDYESILVQLEEKSSPKLEGAEERAKRAVKNGYLVTEKELEKTLEIITACHDILFVANALERALLNGKMSPDEAFLKSEKLDSSKALVEEYLENNIHLINDNGEVIENDL